jgi:hypothetical protein
MKRYFEKAYAQKHNTEQILGLYAPVTRTSHPLAVKVR